VFQTAQKRDSIVQTLSLANFLQQSAQKSNKCVIENILIVPSLRPIPGDQKINVIVLFAHFGNNLSRQVDAFSVDQARDDDDRDVFFRSLTGVGGKGARVYRVRYHGNALAADFVPQDGVFFARVRHANPVVAIGQRQLQ
jgi:hypothetical protein